MLMMMMMMMMLIGGTDVDDVGKWHL